MIYNIIKMKHTITFMIAIFSMTCERKITAVEATDTTMPAKASLAQVELLQKFRILLNFSSKQLKETDKKIKEGNKENSSELLYSDLLYWGKLTSNIASIMNCKGMCQALSVQWLDAKLRKTENKFFDFLTELQNIQEGQHWTKEAIENLIERWKQITKNQKKMSKIWNDKWTEICQNTDQPDKASFSNENLIQINQHSTTWHHTSFACDLNSLVLSLQELRNTNQDAHMMVTHTTLLDGKSKTMDQHKTIAAQDLPDVAHAVGVYYDSEKNVWHIYDCNEDDPTGPFWTFQGNHDTAEKQVANLLWELNLDQNRKQLLVQRCLISSMDKKVIEILKTQEHSFQENSKDKTYFTKLLKSNHNIVDFFKILHKANSTASQKIMEKFTKSMKQQYEIMAGAHSIQDKDVAEEPQIIKDLGIAESEPITSLKSIEIFLKHLHPFIKKDVNVGNIIQNFLKETGEIKHTERKALSVMLDLLLTDCDKNPDSIDEILDKYAIDIIKSFTKKDKHQSLVSLEKKVKF